MKKEKEKPPTKSKKKHKMFKFIRQPNNYSCGPIALYNLLTWSDLHAICSYRNIYKLTKCNSQSGTSTSQFEFVLKFLISQSNNKLHLLKPCLFSFLDLKNQLIANSHYVAIIEYVKEYKFLHFIILFTNSKKEIYSVNQNADNKHFPIVQKAFMEMFQTNTNQQYPIFWILEKI